MGQFELAEQSFRSANDFESLFLIGTCLCRTDLIEYV